MKIKNRSVKYILLCLICTLSIIVGCNAPQKITQKIVEDALSLNEEFPVEVMSGTLNFKVIRAFPTNDLKGSGISVNNFVSDTYASIGEQDYDLAACYDPKTGLLMEGAMLIVVEVEVTNVDAKSDYENPNLQRADSIHLSDVTKVIDSTHLDYENLEYFSLMGMEKEHPNAFELKPGEKKSFQTGFLIGKEGGFTKEDYANLYVTTTSGNPDSIFVNLGIK